MDGKGKAVCRICQKGFSDKRGLTKHMGRMHPDGQMRVKQEPVPSLQCTMCDKTFLRLSHLQRHQSTHLKIREFECPFCAEKFAQKVHVVRHVGRRHPHEDRSVLESHLGGPLKGRGKTAEQPSTSGENCFELVERFLCPKCFNTFTDRHTLSLHMKNLHEKQLECEHCNKAFSGTALLKKHQLHCRASFYACQCGASFDTARNLRAHENACRRITEFKCVEGGCKEQFTQRVQIDRHWKKCHFHNRKCGECDFVAEAPLKLSAHVLKEHNTVICGYCGKADPPSNHISDLHWFRSKQSDPLTANTDVVLEQSEVSGIDVRSDIIARPMSAEDQKLFASMLTGEEMESGDEPSTSMDDTSSVSLEAPPPAKLPKLAHGGTEMPPEIKIEQVPHVYVNIIVRVPKDMGCLELGSMLPEDVAAALPELKEVKVVLTPECQGVQVSLMVPVTSASEEAAEWMKSPIIL